MPGSFRSPEKVLAARFGAADAALRRVLGEQVNASEVAEAAALGREAIEGCSVSGRPLFAATFDTALALSSRIWRCGTPRRCCANIAGDGHVAALLAEGLDGCEAHLTLAGTGSAPRETIQPARGYTDEEWDAAQQRLVSRGWLDEAGKLTERGWAGRNALEERTNELAMPPWRHLGEERLGRLIELARALSGRLVEQGGVPIPNPMGLTWP